MSGSGTPALGDPRAEVSLRRVTKAMGDQVLFRDLDLEVGPGVTLAVTGPSGVGKTTLLRLVAGLVRADSGTVDRPPGAVGYVFQDPRLLPWRSAIDNVLFVLGRRPTAADRRRAQGLLDSLEIGDAADRLPAALSGGMRQRVAIARAVVSDPAVLLVDEPFTSLDRPLRARLTRDLLAVLAERRLPVLWVSHDAAEIATVADRVLELQGGPGAGWYVGDAVPVGRDVAAGSPGPHTCLP